MPQASDVVGLRVLVAPLDWGLGHATRCMPIIDALLAQGAQVVLGSAGGAFDLLRDHYPRLEQLELPGYHVRYSSGRSQVCTLARQLPRLLGVMRQEHELLAELVESHRLQAVISDNRYGLWHPRIPSIMVCHQLCIQLPPFLRWASFPLYRLHVRYLAKFDACWVPDVATSPNLAGRLAHAYPLPPSGRFVGPLSRFQAAEPPMARKPSALNALPPPTILAVLSGPEPQRSQLEAKLREQLLALDQPSWLVQGRPAAARAIRREGSLCVIPFLGSAELQAALQHAKLVISRSGYSSLMDYAALGLKHVLLIPTPGQTEQMYLGALLKEEGVAVCQPQHRLDVAKAMVAVEAAQGFGQWGPEAGFQLPWQDLLKKRPR